MKKLLAVLMVLVLCLPCALAEEAPAAEKAPLLVDRINSPEEHAGFAFAQDARLLEIVFPQILNVDAAFLRCGGETMMIDVASAKYASRVVNMLADLGVESIDVVVCTHPHYDHVQGLATLAEAVEIKEFRIAHAENETEHMVEALALCAEKGIPVTHYQDGTRWEFGGAEMEVWLKGDAAWDLNDRSAVIRIQYGDRNALFTADAQSNLQKLLPEIIPPEKLDIEVLKYPHHGKHALQTPFMEATTPVFAVITNNGKARKSKYCLGLKKIPFAFTVPGYVYLATDGATWLAQRLEMKTTLP